MKTWFQHIMFLRNDKQKIVTDGNPYLCEHGILGSSIECLYVQMLLYPFEEQLNLPSLPVQLGNSQCIKLEVIGEETVNCICAEVFIHNKSKRIGYFLEVSGPVNLIVSSEKSPADWSASLLSRTS